MRAHLVHGPWLPDCINCEQEIPTKRLKSVPYTQYCVNCQAKRDEKIIPFDSAIAICGESDDSTRVIESGWEAIHAGIRTRTHHKVERVLKIYNIPA